MFVLMTRPSKELSRLEVKTNRQSYKNKIEQVIFCCIWLGTRLRFGDVLIFEKWIENRLKWFHFIFFYHLNRFNKGRLYCMGVWLAVHATALPSWLDDWSIWICSISYRYCKRYSFVHCAINRKSHFEKQLMIETSAKWFRLDGWFSQLFISYLTALYMPI